MAAVKHRFVGMHADTVYKGDNAVPVAPGDFVTLSDKDMENEDNLPMLSEGMLVQVSELKKSTGTANETKEVK